MREVKIRGVRVWDVPALLRVAQTSFAEEMSLFSLRPGKIWARMLVFALIYCTQRLRRRPKFKFFVAEVEGRAVGGTMVEWHRDYAYISAVMVHPDFRRQGIGRALLSQALDAAFKFDAKRAVLHVRADNLPARKLYESLGFRPFETRLTLLWEAPRLPQGKPLPPGFTLRKTSPWDERILAIRREAQGPAAAEVYGPPLAPRGLPRLFPSFQTAFLLLRDGVPVGAATIRGGAAAELRVYLSPQEEGAEAAKSFLLQLLEHEIGLKSKRRFFMSRLLSRGSPPNGKAVGRGKKVLLRTSGESAQIIEAAKSLGFREAMREWGMVLKRSS